MEEKPNYYAIIPADVRYNENIRANAKLLYGEITALCNKEGFCWASNNYFANLYGVVPSAVSEWVSELRKEGFITVEYIRNNNTIKQRKIHLVNVVTNMNRLFTKTGGAIHKYDGGYSHSDKDNNTLNITINNREEDFKEKESLNKEKIRKARETGDWSSLKT